MRSRPQEPLQTVPTGVSQATSAGSINSSTRAGRRTSTVATNATITRISAARNDQPACSTSVAVTLPLPLPASIVAESTRTP
jgi:hypothetical protein